MAVNRQLLPTALYTAEACRALDRAAIERFQIPGFRLMQRAGHAVFSEICQRWPEARSLTLLCGRGNNGGDGLIVAGLALQQGWQVQVVTLLETFEYADSLQGEALEAWRWASSVGVVAQTWHSGCEFSGELIVDALLGIGLTGEVQGTAREAIQRMNAVSRPVIAVDIPSGLCADTGGVLGVAVKASLTLTFIGLKPGLLMHQGVDHVGQLLFDALHLPDELYEDIPVSAFRTDMEDLAHTLLPRAASAHKGNFGHLLVVGGDYGLGGAALLAAEAACRSGAGLVSLATRPEHVWASLARRPEVMARAVSSGQDLEPLLALPSVLLIGPGLGRGAWADQMMQKALTFQKSMLFDADALRRLPEREVFASSRRWVMTPHPGEAAELLGMSVEAVQADRFAAVRELQRRFGGVVVLKGAGSLTFDGDAMHLCSAGNPGMAVGGMGDVLSGIIAALMAQGCKPIDAARLGVFAHAAAGDLCALDAGQRGLLPSDLIAKIRELLNAGLS
ncbi:NAD(P)H-hydrate dehydratase [Nitrincola tapanii]|uniref:Bifunctional NAD(P)H-hydrate repair enzyme n=1 Tax=Nitrincola tapanii TaxID=1708751 RepID=A0A5A9W1R9_9GAMM|nr:NAD(P)H-hydrate dehydratase [Nitrincola tapanii]KAA0874740.1 NAD(P)H-hydrate dehydratase [Nitrincola tapanii]